MYRHEWYQQIYERFPQIVSEAEGYGKKLGLDKLTGEIGLYSGSSSCPARLPDYVLNAVVEANQKEILPLRTVEDRLRNVVKDLFGDGYDGAVVNTCEAGLGVAIDALMAPPFMRRGDAYRARMVSSAPASRASSRSQSSRRRSSLPARAASTPLP